MGPALIERGGERHHAPARATAIGRLDADGAGEGGRLADRAAGVGGGRAGAKAGGDCGGRTTGGATGDQRRVRAFGAPGIDHRPVVRGLVGRAHGKLVHVELAQHHRAVCPQVCGDGRLVGRPERVQHVAGGLRVDAFGGEEVLDAERHALERTRLAAGDAPVGLRRHGERFLRCLDDVSVQAPRPLHRGEIGARQFDRGERFRGEAIADAGDGELRQVGHAPRVFS